MIIVLVGTLTAYSANGISGITANVSVVSTMFQFDSKSDYPNIYFTSETKLHVFLKCRIRKDLCS